MLDQMAGRKAKESERKREGEATGSEGGRKREKYRARTLDASKYATVMV